VLDAMGNEEWRMGNGLGPTADSRQLMAVQIKWPNDLLIGDRKAAGILCEQVLGGAARNVLIVGAGINVDFDLELLGPEAELRHPATTLAAAFGRTVGVEEVIESVAGRLVEALQAYEREGFSAAMLAELQEHLAYVGAVRTIASPTGSVTGRVVGINGDGQLLLQTDRGMESVVNGEWQMGNKVES
jgi:BirA family biotin operon repressor/biotin-[acetyl-CoA-carboxylase] ligase